MDWQQILEDRDRCLQSLAQGSCPRCEVGISHKERVVEASIGGRSAGPIVVRDYFCSCGYFAHIPDEATAKAQMLAKAPSV